MKKEFKLDALCDAPVGSLFLRDSDAGLNNVLPEFEAASMPDIKVTSNTAKRIPASEDVDTAADAYVGHAPEIDEDLSAYCKREAFKAGVRWQMKRVWHDADKEQPEDGGTVVVWNPIIKDGEVLCRCVSVYEGRMWAYMDELLPCEEDRS